MLHSRDAGSSLGEQARHGQAGLVVCSVEQVAQREPVTASPPTESGPGSSTMSSRFFRHGGRVAGLAGAACLISLAGCDSTSVTSPAPEAQDPSIVTDQLSYRLTPEGEWLAVTIPATFTNRTGAAVYLLNCNGGFDKTLERWNGSVWVTAWEGGSGDCLSDPIVIGPGESLSRQLHVLGAAPGSNSYPQFDVANPSGAYRLVWYDLLSSFQRDASPYGPPISLEFRVSNTFDLTR
jgi:hypothetical protein